MAKSKEIIIEADLCAHCAFYYSDLECMAFPNGFTQEILVRYNDHSKPLPGQKNKIVSWEGKLTDLTPDMIPYK
jgi:hypothetical protein